MHASPHLFDPTIIGKEYAPACFCQPIIFLRLVDTYAVKAHENSSPMHVSLNNSVTRPFFKKIPGNNNHEKMFFQHFRMLGFWLKC